MLTTQRARVSGPLFIIGWLAGLAAVGAIALSVAAPAPARRLEDIRPAATCGLARPGDTGHRGDTG